MVNEDAYQNAVITPRQVLRKVFGYDDFRHHQEAIITQIINGGHAIALLPTGSGKSLCYQIPALLLHGTTIVISPLIALMQDQVANLKNLGIAALYLASDLDEAQLNAHLLQIRKQQVKILYITPERVSSNTFLNLLKQISVNLLAIDEAHCISHWGHDFRPEYQRLTQLIKHFPQIPRLALTATADSYTQVDIAHHLALQDAPMFTSSFLRANFVYQAIEKNNGKKQLLTFLTKHADESGIIYCASRSKVEELTNYLNEHNFSALAYHAGLDPSIRSKHHQQFSVQQAPIIVATVAFGLGIDKSNVRFVYHFDMPRSIEHFYQESGRAGRDGLIAYSVVSFGLKEILNWQRMIITSDSDIVKKRYELAKLRQMVQYCETRECRVQALLHTLDAMVKAHDEKAAGYEKYTKDEKCGKCDNCVYQGEVQDVTAIAQAILLTISKIQEKATVSNLIDILRGKLSLNVQISRYDRLATFALYAHISSKVLRRIIRKLYSLEIIDLHYKYSYFCLNKQAHTVMHGLKDVHL